MRTSLPVPVPRMARGLRVLLAASALAACDGGARSEAPEPAGPVGTVSLSAPVPLFDGDAPILARPILVSVSPRGEIVIGDRSDRDVKMYAPTGVRLRTVGRAGGGPGEFTSLQVAQSYGDSLAAYDASRQRVVVFAPDGEEARAFSPDPPAFGMRVVDDSLFLLIRHPAEGGKLLRLVRPDGSLVREFFDAAHAFRDPRLNYLTRVFADGADGRIFAGVFGKDSVFAFDYRGRSLARGPIPATAPMGTMDAAFTRAGEREQAPDGRWFHDGLTMLMTVVALPEGHSALFLAPYDTRSGTDLLEGGELLVVAVDGRRLRPVARQRVDAGLFGRDADGAPILLRYRDASASAIDLVRAEVK